jgi:hypothetical protein
MADRTVDKHRDANGYHDALQGFIGGEPDFDVEAFKPHRFGCPTSSKILQEAVIQGVQRGTDGAKVRQERHRLWHQRFWLALQAKVTLRRDQRFWLGAGAPDRGGGDDLDKLREALIIMLPALGVGEDLIGFYDVLERRGTLWTNAVGMIEFGKVPVGTQNVTGCSSPWHP